MKTIFEGAVKKTNATGRPRLEYGGSHIMDDIDYHYFTDLKKFDEDREAWRAAGNQS